VPACNAGVVASRFGFSELLVSPSVRPPSSRFRLTLATSCPSGFGHSARCRLVLNDADLAHNPEVAGSNPAPATKKCRSEGPITGWWSGLLDRLSVIRLR